MGSTVLRVGLFLALLLLLPVNAFAAISVSSLSDSPDPVYQRIPPAYGSPNITISGRVQETSLVIRYVTLSIKRPSNQTDGVTLTTNANTDDYSFNYTYYPNETGIYEYTVYANNSNGENVSSVSTFQSINSTASFLFIAPQQGQGYYRGVGQIAKINATIQDPHNDTANVTFHLLSPSNISLSMTAVSPNQYAVNYTVAEDVWHFYKISANDSQGNYAESSIFVFNDQRSQNAADTSVNISNACVGEFDFLGPAPYGFATNITLPPTANVTEFVTEWSLFRNAGNLEFNLTDNCISVYKKNVTAGDYPIIIDNTTSLVSECCWSHSNVGWYCTDWGSKANVRMPAFTTNEYEHFYSHINLSHLTPGKYNITAKAFFSRYNESDCTLYGNASQACTCSGTANRTVELVITDREGESPIPNPTPQPVPIPVPQPIFIDEAKLVIVREMVPWHSQNNSACSNQSLGSCDSALVKMILYNKGGTSAYNISVNDLGYIAQSAGPVNCPLGSIDLCFPTNYSCDVLTGYDATCSIGTLSPTKTGLISNITFTVDAELLPKEYHILQYLWYSGNQSSLYNSYKYDFNATANYVTSQYNGSTFQNVSRSSVEDDGLYNDGIADKMELRYRPSFHVAIDTTLEDTIEKRDFVAFKNTVFAITMTERTRDNFTIPFTAKLKLPSEFTITGCDSDTGISCTYDTENKTITWTISNTYTYATGPSLRFSATTDARKNHKLSMTIAEANDTVESFSPLFLISNDPNEEFTEEPLLVIIRELPEYMNQKAGCSVANPWSGGCAKTTVRLIIHNRGTADAYNVTLSDTINESICTGTTCNPVAFRCVDAPILEDNNVSYSTYSCATNTTNTSQNNVGSVSFNVTKQIPSKGYVILEYDFIPVNNATYYSSGDNYYDFDAVVSFESESGGDFPDVQERDESYNPTETRKLYLKERSTMEFNLDTQSLLNNTNRDISLFGLSTFNVTLKAITADATIVGPWQVTLNVPADIAVSSCSPITYPSDVCTITPGNITSKVIYTGNSSLTDGSTVLFSMTGTSANTGDEFISINATNNFVGGPGTTPDLILQDYQKGIWVVTQVKSVEIITIEVPVPEPQPVPEPEPEPEPEPDPVPEPQPIRKADILIQPLNWTLFTYAGGAVEAIFNITNRGDAALEQTILRSVQYAGWDYTEPEVPELAAGQSLLIRKMFTPSLDTKPGFYVIPVFMEASNNTQVGLGFIQIEVLNGTSRVQLSILETLESIKLKRDTKVAIPVLVKNTGATPITNLTARLENLDDCIEQQFAPLTTLGVNETVSLLYTVKTGAELKNCKGHLIVSSAEKAFAFAPIEISLAATATVKESATLFLALFWSLLTGIYYGIRKFLDSKVSSEDHAPQEKQPDFILYAVVLIEVLVLAYAGISYWGIL